MMVRFSGILVYLARPSEEMHRIGKSPLLQPDQSQTMYRTQVAIIRIDHDPIQLFCFRQLAALMECKSFFERLEHGPIFARPSRRSSLAH